jgi:hypothetical protein
VGYRSEGPAIPFSAVEIGDDIADFHGAHWHGGRGRSQRDEVGRLLTKAHAVAQHVDEVAAFVGYVGRKQAWRVRPLVVTPAAFALTRESCSVSQTRPQQSFRWSRFPLPGS